MDILGFLAFTMIVPLALSEMVKLLLLPKRRGLLGKSTTRDSRKMQ